MTSILGKLICKELGKNSYRRYFQSLSDKQSTDVFLDIYTQLKEKDKKDLSERLIRLLETIRTSVKISRSFLFVMLFYLAAMTGLFFIVQQGPVMFFSMALATVCVIYKIIEFISNRHCDQDIRMVLIYKSILFHLLDKEKI